MWRDEECYEADLPKVDDVSNAGASVPEASVSSPEDIALKQLKKGRLFSQECLPERLSSAYFCAIGDLKFQDCFERYN